MIVSPELRGPKYITVPRRAAVKSQAAQPTPGVREHIRLSKSLPFVMSQKADFQIGALDAYSEKWSEVKDVKGGLSSRF